MYTHTHTRKGYSVGNSVISDLEDIMLSEINQTQKKQTIYEFILMWNLNTLSTYSRSEENSGYQKPGRCGEG